jgi:hypothetical protein
MKEKWKDIIGYEGFYMVSNLGRVKSLPKQAGFMFRKERILKPNVTHHGYHRVTLQKDGHIKSLAIHRLVALAFIKNPNMLPYINHKDENKTNNCVNNLEWCDVAYNNNDGTRTERMSRSKINGAGSKVVLQYDTHGNFIKEWESAAEIERQLGFQHSNISSCCQLKPHYKTIGGFVWRFKN